LGRFETLEFGSFLDALTDDDDNNNNGGSSPLYLTTQKRSTELDLVGPPLVSSSSALLNDVLMRPKLVGGLVPARVNMWFGRSRSGTSSGLHHDFEDSLYVLLRGRKVFRLWDPSSAQRLRTRGCVARVASNGRVEYAGAPPVRADGAPLAVVARLAAEAELAAAERAVRSGEAGAEARLERAEEALDEALAEALGGGRGELAPDPTTADDDEEEEEENGEEEEEEELFDSDLDDYAAAEGDGDGDGDGDEVEEASRLPPNFSLADPAEEAAKGGCVEVTLHAGESLYLPAGWFHEVRSFSDDGASATHLAVSMWFHAPGEQPTFEAPYPDAFWERKYENELEKLLM